jgi:ribonuclease P protein component
VVHLDTARSASPTVVGAGELTLARTENGPVRAGVEQSSAPARAGFVVSRAVGGAVVRNRVRRRLRHLVGDRLTGLPPGATLVVRALPDAATTSYDRLGADLDAAIAAARAPRRPGRRSR